MDLMDRNETSAAPNGLMDRVRKSTVGRSIWRSPDRVTPRDRAAGHWSNFFLHIYPVKMRRHEIGIRYSWYLGAISTVLSSALCTAASLARRSSCPK